jgi:hypothetical protein
MSNNLSKSQNKKYNYWQHTQRTQLGISSPRRCEFTIHIA